MSTLILRATTRGLAPLIAGFSLYLLLRGHNNVGGGFSGGLVAGAAIVLIAFAYGCERLRRVRWLRIPLLVGGGLLVATGYGLAGLALGQPFLSGAVLSFGQLKVAASLVFDVGVYAVVVGLILVAVTCLGEDGT